MQILGVRCIEIKELEELILQLGAIKAPENIGHNVIE